VRKAIPKQIETEVLTRCRRRCAICYGLNLDRSIRRGQIAHIDRNAANNALDNLVFLCFDHHDEYDSRPSQGKGLTAGEVRLFRSELLASIETTWKDAKPFNITPLIDITNISGHYVWETEISTAELDIRAISHDEIEVSGLAFWGTDSPYGPNIGQLDFKAPLSENTVIYVDPSTGYEIHILFTHRGLSLEEKNLIGQFGLNVSFGGDFVRSEKAKREAKVGVCF